MAASTIPPITLDVNKFTGDQGKLIRELVATVKAARTVIIAQQSAIEALQKRSA